MDVIVTKGKYIAILRGIFTNTFSFFFQQLGLGGQEIQLIFLEKSPLVKLTPCEEDLQTFGILTRMNSGTCGFKKATLNQETQFKR